MARQVMCINKQDRDNPHERILFIGGVQGGQRWKHSQTDAIANIESGRESYYVTDQNTKQSVWVIVKTSRLGHKYLTTEADGDTQNNLLSLPECP